MCLHSHAHTYIWGEYVDPRSAVDFSLFARNGISIASAGGDSGNECWGREKVNLPIESI